MCSSDLPGSIASLRQEWGRAGRRRRGLGVLVLGDDAIDQWFARHPQALLARPVEAVALDPGNPDIRLAHLACAAAEAAVSERDAAILGVHIVEDAEAAVALAPDDFAMTPAGLIWTGRDDPATRVSLRSAGFEVDAQLIALALEQRVPARSFAEWLPIIRVAMAVTRQLLDDRFSRPRLDEEHLRLVILMIESYLANFIPD